MVLVCNGGAEERHNTVPPNLVHRTFVAVDRLHHSHDDRVEELAGLLRIAVGKQLHGTLEIGEEDRDLLALTLERAFGGENLFGEVLGGVAPRRGEPRCFVSSGDGLPALEAKLRARRQGAVTLTASEREAYSAFQTELGVQGIFVLAPWTVHNSCPTRP